jgi:hypothetical protein
MEGRLQEWRRDIRLFSTSIEARANLRLQLVVLVQSSFDTTQNPADIVFVPTVDAAELSMHSFKLLRLSRADGPIIREVGDLWEPLLEEWLDELNEELPERLNRQLAKKQDQFRLSLADLTRKRWLDWLVPKAEDSSPRQTQP